MILHLYGLAARLACATSSATTRIAQAIRDSWIGTVPDCLAVAEFGMENPREVSGWTFEPVDQFDEVAAEMTPIDPGTPLFHAVRSHCIRVAAEDRAEYETEDFDEWSRELTHEGETWN